MTRFAPRQPKRAKKVTSPVPSSLQLSRAVPETTSVAGHTPTADWQEQVEQATRAGHSIAHLAIHGQRETQNEAVLQGKAQGETEVTATEIVSPRGQQESTAGLSGSLKVGIETLSGLSMDDVQVHYNSQQPATVQALAYTQGSEIHVGPGQEQHLAHEAWHVVQQKQGRVQPTMQTKGVAINDDATLEREADVMGARAGSLSMQASTLETLAVGQGTGLLVQRVMGTDQDTQKKLRLRKLNGALKDGKQLYLLSKTGEVYVEVEDGLEGLIVAKTGEVRMVSEKPPAKSLTGSKRNKDEDEGEDGGAMEEEDEESDERPMKKEKEEKKEEMEEERETIRDIFTQYLSKYKITDKLISAIVVDLDLKRASAIDIKFLKQSSEKEVASCFETARRLLELLGDPASDAMNTWEDRIKVGAGIPKLLSDIEAHKNSACIYRVGVGGTAHGFAIVIQNNTAEVLQGFAGPSGESLAENIERKGLYSIADIKTHLQNLIGNDADASFSSQKELFSEPIDIEKIPEDDKKKIQDAEKNKNYRRADPEDEKEFAGFAVFYRDLKADEFQCERRGLYSQEKLMQRVEEKILTGLRALGEKVKK